MARLALRNKTTNLLSAIVYGICILPGSLLLHAFRADLMQGKPDPSALSYWKKHEALGLSKPMKYPF